MVYNPTSQRSKINIFVFILLDIFLCIHDFFLTIFVRSLQHLFYLTEMKSQYIYCFSKDYAVQIFPYY